MSPRTSSRLVAKPVPSLSYVVGRLDKALASAMGEKVAKYGVTLPQYTALSVLEIQSGLSNAQLARRAFVRPQSMMQVVSELERKGLIERALEPDNGRILRTKVTKAGHRLLEDCNNDVAELEKEMLADVAPADRDIVLEALISCVRRLGGGLLTSSRADESSA
ncbi:MarR family transcriptional regulator [Nocardioides sp. QY071]|uniref:MarR family winged helix-turn-helix transcriptional regulator n=1 Tax=Nocardioides sp. QY071 TaxID=3044187 RepID=UPI00249A67F3|nr:MarR family transcriptional regulator [Nocardioides sp. QY071]WGY01687.1 MarR family transcriptional regulator [Nocardioides sp. QY071]